MSRDFQRQKVYDWECACIPKGSFIAFENLESYVNNVWSSEGFKYPPLVKQLSKTDNASGRGNREAVWFPEAGSNERIVLHELAHSLTNTVHGHSDRHGPTFVGVYINLLEKYMGVNKLVAWHTAKEAGIQFDMFASPTFNNIE